MKAVLKKWLQALRKSPAGFTLVELLVVVGIIVALAAIIVPSVAQFANRGDIGARAGELSSVQSAFDTLMADVGVLTVDPYNLVTDTATNTFSAEPTGTWTGGQVLDDYLRDGPTRFFYCWDGDGRVYNTLDPDSVAPEDRTYFTATSTCASS